MDEIEQYWKLHAPPEEPLPPHDSRELAGGTLKQLAEPPAPGVVEVVVEWVDPVEPPVERAPVPWPGVSTTTLPLQAATRRRSKPRTVSGFFIGRHYSLARLRGAGSVTGPPASGTLPAMPPRGAPR